MVITFYSFKGGLGRSMALANVAEILYRRGLRVLMIDWDLEAPGLDQFFRSVVDYEIREHSGLIDLLVAYKTWSSKPGGELIELPPTIADYVQDIYPPSERGARLMLLSAGRRDEEYFNRYTERVKKFDWEDFYRNWEGERYIEWTRHQMEDIADVILIDSRTGITEMGNVCIHHLADLVVAFTSASRQSLEGTARVLETLEDPHIRRLRAERPLETIVIPARVEDKAELASYNTFKQEFSELFDQYCPKRWHEETQQVLWDLKIPYVPLYAFEELVAIRQKGTEHESDLLEEAFRRQLEAIDYVLPLPRPGPRRVLIIEDDKQWQTMLQEVFSTSGYEIHVVGDADSAIDELKKDPFGLVLLNLNLKHDLEQDFDGLSVLRWMQAQGVMTPVVIVTGSTISMGQFRRWPMVRDIVFKGSDITSPQLMGRIRDLLSHSMEGPLPKNQRLPTTEQLFVE